MELRNREDGMLLAEISLPEGWEEIETRLERYRNFCFPIKMSSAFKKGDSSMIYRSGEGFSDVGGSDEKKPQTIFIDYRHFETIEEYMKSTEQKLSELLEREVALIKTMEVPFDEEKGLKKVEEHAVREIKRQGGGNKILIHKLYYKALCGIFHSGDSLIAVNSHIEAVKAGMDISGFRGNLGDRSKFGSDDDLRSLNPMQTLDWQNTDMFILVTKKDADSEDGIGAKNQKLIGEFLNVPLSFANSEAYEELSEQGKKEISSRLFIQGRSSRKMQAKKYAEWRKINEAEKKESDLYLKAWFQKNLEL